MSDDIPILSVYNVGSLYLLTFYSITRTCLITDNTPAAGEGEPESRGGSDVEVTPSEGALEPDRASRSGNGSAFIHNILYCTPLSLLFYGFMKVLSMSMSMPGMVATPQPSPLVAGMAVTPSPVAGVTSQVESESQADVEDALSENSRQSDRDNRSQNHRVWTDYLLGFHTVRNHPNLLVGWISGAAARHCESLDAEQVLQSCSSVLKRHVNADWSYTEPVAVLRSTWYTNPFFCGSYSYRSQETERHSGSGAHILAAPVSDSSGRARLFFAGEATHDHFYSTVHGAVETGFRAAQQIVDQWRNYGRYLAKL